MVLGTRVILKDLDRAEEWIHKRECASARIGQTFKLVQRPAALESDRLVYMSSVQTPDMSFPFSSSSAKGCLHS